MGGRAEDNLRCCEVLDLQSSGPLVWRHVAKMRNTRISFAAGRLAAASKSLFTISQIGSMANALMKAHNEKLASMLLEEVPGDRVDLTEHAREKSERKSKAKSKDPKSELAELKKQQARLQGGGDGNDADAEN